MVVKTKQENLGFQTEVKQLLELMIHSLYSEKEIFLRELISNASDAVDKLRFEALQDENLYEAEPDLHIRVEYNKENKTVTVLDNGIGMSREEVIKGLGTIAKSGTKEFFDSLTGDQIKDSQMIGQFGVGFYSTFVVAQKVEVTTRKAGLSRSEGIRWISDGTDGYTIETTDKPQRGTKVVLYLRDDAAEFLDGMRLRHVIRKYSDHISLPIIMPSEDRGDEGSSDKEQDIKPVVKDETVNTATALWKRDKKSIKKDEYHEFYKHLSHDFNAPLDYIHNRVEGKLEYVSLLYIPEKAPFDLWDRQQRHGVKLYVHRVFIMDDAEHLLPAYLRFIRGVVDSDDLPLNVSREILQKNKTIDSIRSGITRKVIDLLSRMAKNKAEKYAIFWKEFGRVIKEGIIEEADKKETLAKLFRFSSTHTDQSEQTVSLEDYIGRMGDDQDKIYYVIADSFSTAKNSPHLEIFRKNGIEVLLLSDSIDEWLATHMTEFQGKQLQSVAKGELDINKIDKKKSTGSKQKDSAASAELIKRIQQALESKVNTVRQTERLIGSPACLVADEDSMGLNLERILQASGQDVPASKPILEINIEHPLVSKLSTATDEQFNSWAHILFDQALLSEGGQLQDPAGFVQRINNMFMVMDSTATKSSQKKVVGEKTKKKQEPGKQPKK